MSRPLPYCHNPALATLPQPRFASFKGTEKEKERECTG